MCLFARARLAAGRYAPGRARRLADSQLTAALTDCAGAEDSIEDALLVVSELVNHAVLTGAADIVVDVEVHRDHVRAVVSDDAPHQPHVRRGRELQIIDQTARNWGTVVTDEGNEIWGVLPNPRAATAGLACTVSSLV